MNLSKRLGFIMGVFILGGLLACNDNNSTPNGSVNPGSETVSYQDRGGYVMMEFESLTIPDDSEWIFQRSLGGYTGEGYIQFTGNGICNGPPASPLRYPITLSTASTYFLSLRGSRIWHCVVGEADTDGGCVDHGDCDGVGEPINEVCPSGQCLRKDLSNDAFVHFENENGEYMPYNGQRDRFIGEPTKLFGGGQNEFTWTGNNSLDQGGDKYRPEWDLEAGNYTLVIQGRSQGFRIDRMMLFDTNQYTFNEARNNAENWSETRLTD